MIIGANAADPLCWPTGGANETPSNLTTRSNTNITARRTRDFHSTVCERLAETDQDCRSLVCTPRKNAQSALNPIDITKTNTPSPPEFGGWGYSGQARRWRSIPSSRRVDQRESNVSHSIPMTYHPKDGVGDPTQFHYIRAVLTTFASAPTFRHSRGGCVTRTQNHVVFCD
jgi:hypothetical protein